MLVQCRSRLRIYHHLAFSHVAASLYTLWSLWLESAAGMNRCFSTLLGIVNGGRPCVLVTVAHIAGSAPREPGARMIVTDTGVMGSIGGGNLEFEAIGIARSRLDATAASEDRRFIELFPLGPMLQQCCGGAVFLHFEILSGAEPPWIASASGMEQENSRAVLVSRVSQVPVPTSFLPKRESAAGASQESAAGVYRELTAGASQESAAGVYRELTAGASQEFTTGAFPLPGAGQKSSGKMMFTRTGVAGSLGDKSVDEVAAVKAKTLLYSERAAQTTLLHSLVETHSSLPDTSDALFFEVISPTDFQVALFGAGHVGRALVNALASATDCHITWVDSRAGQFPGELPSNVEARFSENPAGEVENLPGRAYCLVMTHDHQLDQDLCEAMLRRHDFSFLGLIGSATKHRRFVQRLREKGISDEQLERLTCPIGIPGIESKEPGVIAVSVAAQLLKIQSADAADSRRLFFATEDTEITEVI